MRRPYQRCHPVRDEEARKKWRLKKGNRCQACGGRPDFRGLHVHHLERFMRSDEPTNLLLLDARCHGMTHDEPTQDGRLTQGMLVLVKWLEDPDEFDLERLSELKGSPVEFEDLPEWLWHLRKRKRLEVMRTVEDMELVELKIDLLDDHPKNPRVVFRDDVIDGIAANLNGSFPKHHALHVRRAGGRFEIVAGHTRKRAALKAGLMKVWCWVDTLSDDDAYMALATSNNQGELSPLEIGIHCLRAVAKGEGGRGKKGGLSEYAEKLGKSQGYMSQVRNAAEVVVDKPISQLIGFLDKSQHLSAIHALPKAIWPSMAEALLAHGWSVDDTESHVKAGKEYLAAYDVPKEWQTYLPKNETALRVATGTDPNNFSKLLSLAAKVASSLAEHDSRDSHLPRCRHGGELATKWCDWLTQNAGGDSWDIKKAQDKRVELEELLWECENAEDEPTDCASLILADPPWQYDFAETDNRQIENQYPSRTVAQIIEHIDSKKMPRISPDAILFLWATAPKLREALEVMEGWGFEYKTHAVWDKQKIGMGYWFRGRHELLLVGTRGNASPPDTESRVDSVFSEARNSKHSAKPECVYEWIEKAFPEAVKLEMYTRKARSGWLAFGNEVET